MVAVADVIKKMRSEGMTREQIIESLSELGFPNAEALYEKNAGATGGAGAPKPPTPKLKPEGLAEAAEREEKEEAEETGETREAEEAGEDKEKPLFGQPAKKQENEEETPETEEPLELRITQVSDEGLEKTVSIEDMLTKEGAATTASASSAASGATLADASLRAKLEETNALLRALADVNKKILETDREVLMRLKAKETQTTQATQATQSAKT